MVRGGQSDKQGDCYRHKVTGFWRGDKLMRQRDTVIADFQKHPGGFRIRIYVVVGMFIFLLLSLLIVAAWPVITVIAFWLAVSVAIVGAVLALVGVCAVFFYIWHWARREAAKTRRIEREADFIHHDHNHVAWQWQGRQLVPLYEPRQSILLPAETEQETIPQTLDFLTVMTQPKRVFSVVADQQTGKTTLCHYLVEYWMQRGIKPVVIGQKYDAGEYRNCERFGPDNDSILAGFEAIRQEAQYRQQLADEGQPFGEMELQPIFLEDFTNMTTVLDRSELERFVGQALTAYAARGLLLYFIAHSRAKEAYGLTRQGASLKNQMTRLEIIATYDNKGNVDHSRKKIVCTIGSNSEPAPVTGVPGYRPNLDRDCRLALYSLAIPVMERAIDPAEKTVIEMTRAGANISTIATAVYGSKGGPQNNKVKDIQAKYSLV